MKYIALAILLCSLASAGHAAKADDVPNQLLASVVHSLANDVKNDSLLQGKQLTLTTVDPIGEEAHRSNSGLEIERILRADLNDMLNNKAELTLAGTYRLDDGKVNLGLKVLVVKAQVKDKHDKEIASFEREVNNTDELFRVLGVPGFAPNATLKQRNGAFEDAVKKPDFDKQDNFRISAKGKPQWSVGLRTRTNLQGPGAAVAPENVDGLAFVKIAVGEYYEVELKNADKSDAIAKVDIDGLDAANTFAADNDTNGKKINWPGYLVPAGKTVTIRGWLHTVDQTKQDNVFSFLVAEHGHGAATAMKSRGTVGVINVQFREACPPGGHLSGRSFGETAKGDGLSEKLEVKEVQIGENVVSNVSVRYNRPSEP